jgi:hypothetical protein
VLLGNSRDEWPTDDDRTVWQGTRDLHPIMVSEVWIKLKSGWKKVTIQ